MHHSAGPDRGQEHEHSEEGCVLFLWGEQRSQKASEQAVASLYSDYSRQSSAFILFSAFGIVVLWVSGSYAVSMGYLRLLDDCDQSFLVLSTRLPFDPFPQGRPVSSLILALDVSEPRPVPMTSHQSVDSTSSAPSLCVYEASEKASQALILGAHSRHGRFEVLNISCNTLTVVLVPLDEVGQAVLHVSGKLRVDPAT